MILGHRLDIASQPQQHLRVLSKHSACASSEESDEHEPEHLTEEKGPADQGRFGSFCKLDRARAILSGAQPVSPTVVCNDLLDASQH